MPSLRPRASKRQEHLLPGVDIRLKEHDELMSELPTEDEQIQHSPSAGNRYRQQVKQFRLQGQFKSVFNGGVRVR
jgi:hypothetical protein